MFADDDGTSVYFSHSNPLSINEQNYCYQREPWQLMHVNNLKQVIASPSLHPWPSVLLGLYPNW